MDNNDYQKLYAHARAYLNNRYALLRLELLEKLSHIIGIIIMSLVVVLLVFSVLAFLGMAAIFALATIMPMWLSCCILAGVFVVLIIVACVNKKRWFIEPVLRTLSTVLFAESASTEENTAENNIAEEGGNHE